MARPSAVAMRILLVNVNTSAKATDAMVAVARRVVAAEVVGITPVFGSAGVDSNTQSLIAAVGVLDAVASFSEPYDAVVLGGFGEHGREGLVELVEVPVVDITESAVHVAMMLGRTFSIVTTLPRSAGQIEDRLLLAGLRERCASVRSVGLSTRELDVEGAAATAAVVDAARAAVEQDGAEVVVLGCGGMAGLSEIVSREVSVPVVDPVTTGVLLAESLVRLGLRTSTVGSCAPPDLSETAPWPLRGVFER
jgi:allantoin racemase